MARGAIVVAAAAAANSSHSNSHSHLHSESSIRRQNSLGSESSRRRKQRRRGTMQKENRSPNGRIGNNNVNRNGVPKARSSKYGAVDDAEVVGGQDDGDDELDENGDRDDYEYHDDDDDDDEDDDDELEEEEEEYAYTLSPSSYKRTIRLYTFVPFTAGLTLLFFTLLQKYLWPPTSSSSNPNISTTLSLLLLGTAFWTVSFALRVPLFLLSSHLFYTKPALIPLVSNTLQVLCEEILRFASIALAQISVTGKVRVGDQSFSYVWTIALGWAMAEVVVSIWQGYTQLGLYTDVIVVPSFPSSPSSSSPPPSKYYPEYGYNHFADTPHALESRAQARSELESLYGIPVPEIPVSISCLLRVDTIMLSIALFLLISFSYLSRMSIPLPSISVPSFTGSKAASAARLTVKARSLSAAAPRPSNPSTIKPPSSFTSNPFTSTLPTFVGVTVFHTLLGLAWTPNVLPHIGLHVASYCSCVAALGAFFVGLGWWDAI